MLEYTIVLYQIIMSIIDFFLMAADKRKAKKRAGRIPENTMTGIGILGGAAGLWLGMCIFKHKTLHVKFKIIAPVSFFLWTALNIYLFIG